MPSTAIPGTDVPGASGPSSGGHHAPVLEFLCLFTHDLRRKQKRWQDGRLKYHAFNKRVMVYDDRGHFVGDMHWRREWEFDEGEEVELERGGIIVQVAECVGRQNQDLSELLDKRVKEREQRQARVATRSRFSAPSAPTSLSTPVAQDHFQTRHRPLNQLLGTPTGHHGRASVPTESPFELRQKASEASGDHPGSRPVKRRKYDATPPSKMGYAQSLFGAPLTLSAVPMSSAPPRQPMVLASRTASETPTPLEEATPSAERQSEDTGLCAQRGPITKPSGDDLGGAPSGLRSGPERHAARSRKEVPERTIGGLDPRKAISARQVSGSAMGGVAGHRSALRNEGEGPTSTVEATISHKSTERKSLEEQSRHAIHEMRSKIGDNATNARDLQSGTSCSQAILVDEGTDTRLEGANGYTRLGDTAKQTDRPRPVVSTAARRKPTKRDFAAQLPGPPSVEKLNSNGAPTENAEPLPREERTELRLKPRQKRGLLVFSEKKDRPQQPKRQRTVTSREPNLANDTSAESVDTAPSGPPLRPLAGASDPSSKGRDGGPLASSFLASEGPPYKPALPPPPPRQRQASQRSDERGLGKEKGCLLSNTVSLGTEEAKITATSLPGPLELICDNGDSVEGDLPNHSPSPPVKTLVPRDRTSNQARKARQLRTSADGNTEGSSTGLLSDAGRSRSTRQTRKIHDKDRGVSIRSTKDVYIVGSDDDSEELPEVPVGPRLARLGRKSVRSMEVIGFVPSSSPMVDMVKAGEPQAGSPSDTGPPNTDNDAVAHADSPEEHPAVTGEGLGPSHVVQHLAGASVAFPLLEASTRAAGPALQRHSSLPDNDTRDTAIRDPREEGGEASTIQHLGDPPSHQVLVPLESSGEKDTPPQQSVSSLPNTARPKRDITETVRPYGIDRIRTAEPTALESQSHKPSNFPKRAGHPMNVKDDTAGYRSLGAEGTSPPLLSIPSAGTAGRPRIQNPATRGRKAALKSDAAGQVPQSILPTEPILARPGLRPPAMMRLEPVVVNERPKRTMRFPGFVSARGGGPWSREAHDLLESTRPS